MDIELFTVWPMAFCYLGQILGGGLNPQAMNCSNCQITYVLALTVFFTEILQSCIIAIANTGGSIWKVPIRPQCPLQCFYAFCILLIYSMIDQIFLIVYELLINMVFDSRGGALYTLKEKWLRFEGFLPVYFHQSV